MSGFGSLLACLALGLAASASWAMEPLADADLANTSGQAGLTVGLTNPSLSTSSVRYYDSDGMSATGVAAYGIAANPVYLTSDGTATGTPLPGPCGGLLNLTCVNNFGVAGASLNFNGFSASASNVRASFDVGSTGTGAGAKSGLLLGLQVNNLNLNLGAISMDNGDELKGLLGAGGPTNAPVYTSGALTSGNDLGGVALTQLSIPKLLTLVTAGAPALGTSSGLTITSLLPFNMQFNFVYYNTTAETYSGGVFTPTAGHVANDGLLVVPVYLQGVNLGPIEVSVGNSGGGYATSSSQGLDIAFSGATIDLIDFGGEALGGSGMQVAGTDFGSLAMMGVHVKPLTVSISGH